MKLIDKTPKNHNKSWQNKIADAFDDEYSKVTTATDFLKKMLRSTK